MTAASSRRIAAAAKAAGWCDVVISSKGRYALRVMVDLAEHGGDGYVSMRDVARRQELSDKYAGQVMSLLSRAGLVSGVTGKGGGYRLTREPSDYSIGEIIRAADGSLSCLGTNGQLTRCEVSSGLSTVWNRLDKQIAACLDAIPLSTLATADAADEYVI